MPLRDAPVPTDGLWNDTTKLLDLTFSHPIRVAAPLDTGNWFIRFSGRSQTVIAASAVGGIVRVLTSGIVSNPGPNVVSFSPPPFDVISDTVRPLRAEAFTDFPIHV